MHIIVETDLGHDPDDFLAICWLVSAGVSIQGIVLHPGDPQQISLATFLCHQLGLDIPVAAAIADRDKTFNLGVHQEIMDLYASSGATTKPNSSSDDVFEFALQDIPECSLLVLGPVKASASWLKKTERVLYRATMQGGFLGYNVYRPKVTLDKFEGMTSCPTFNLNGDRKGGEVFISSEKIKERRFVGKNICHTVTYNAETHKSFKVKCRASELFYELMDLYLKRHDEKKLHDPTAAVCHLHPEIGTWVRGKTVKEGSGWATRLSENADYILADIDYNQLFDYLLGNYDHN